MKAYCEQNIFKEKATLARKEKEFQKGTLGITSDVFLNTFIPKMDALHIKTRKIKKGRQPIFGKYMQVDRNFLQKLRFTGIPLNSGDAS